MPAYIESSNGPQHLTIDPDQQWEVDFWVRKLGVNAVDLRRAIAATGGNALDVIHLLTSWDSARAS